MFKKISCNLPLESETIMLVWWLRFERALLTAGKQPVYRKKKLKSAMKELLKEERHRLGNASLVSFLCMQNHRTKFYRTRICNSGNLSTYIIIFTVILKQLSVLCRYFCFITVLEIAYHYLSNTRCWRRNWTKTMERAWRFSRLPYKCTLWRRKFSTIVLLKLPWRSYIEWRSRFYF